MEWECDIMTSGGDAFSTKGRRISVAAMPGKRCQVFKLFIESALGWRLGLKDGIGVIQRGHKHVVMDSRISTSGWLSDFAYWRGLVIQHGTDVLWASSGSVRQEKLKDISTYGR